MRQQVSLSIAGRARLNRPEQVYAMGAAFSTWVMAEHKANAFIVHVFAQKVIWCDACGRWIAGTLGLRTAGWLYRRDVYVFLAVCDCEQRGRQSIRGFSSCGEFAAVFPVTYLARSCTDGDQSFCLEFHYACFAPCGTG